MKCRECDACKKGWFKSSPNLYVCIGVKYPFVIENIDTECVAYDYKREKVASISEQVATQTEEKNAWVVSENGCVITCPKCGERLELCYPDGTEVRYLPHCPWCGKRLDE